MTIFFEVLLIVLCVAVVFGVTFSAIKRKKKGGGCSGDCSHCSACYYRKKEK